MKTSELLRRAGERHYRSPCQGDLALNSAGYEARPWGPNACAWCALGALWADEELDIEDEAELVLDDAAETFGFADVAQANESPNGHINIMPDIWSEAIEAAEELERMGVL